jgi:hypothetical protein
MTLGRHSMGRFMPGARISQAHGTTAPVDPASGARDATVFAMYHPAAALRGAEVERQSFEDVGHAPQVLIDSRARRASAEPARTRTAAGPGPATGPTLATEPELAPALALTAEPAPDAASDLTIF